MRSRFKKGGGESGRARKRDREGEGGRESLCKERKMRFPPCFFEIWKGLRKKKTAEKKKNKRARENIK